MHTRTIAALLMSTIEEAMEKTPEDVPHIVSSENGESADINFLTRVKYPGGEHNQSSFEMEVSDGSRFRIDVVRIG